MPIKRTLIREKTTPDSVFPRLKEGGVAYIKEKYIDTGAILSNTTTYKNSADEVILFSDLATKKIIETVFKDYEQKDSYSRDTELRKFTARRPISAEFPTNAGLNQLINYGPILQANSGIIFSQTEVEI
jgi:hypothetical protein